jgi:hypothetical protein
MPPEWGVCARCPAAISCLVDRLVRRRYYFTDYLIKFISFINYNENRVEMGAEK